MSSELDGGKGPKTRRINRILIISIVGLLLLILIVVGFFGLRSVRASVEQPLPYSHRVHVQNGIQCLYCHTEAMRSQIAGIPSVGKCMGCHNVIATESDAVQMLSSYWEEGESIPWQRINDQPDFVYFSHQPHLGAGINCETCHGNVGEMDFAEENIQMDMGWCLDCHEHQDPIRVAYLLDCLACHK